MRSSAWMRTNFAWVTVSAVALLGTEAAANSGVLPTTEQETLNLYTEDHQHSADYARTPDGAHFAGVWSSENQDGDGYGIFARFSGSSDFETQVNTTTAGFQGEASVAMTDVGRTVVVWQGFDGVANSVYGRLFDHGGGPLSGEFLVETLTGNHQAPRVDFFPDNNFVVAWQSDASAGETMMRVFDPFGTPLTSHMIVGSTDATGLDVAVNDAGIALISWRAPIGANPGIYYRLLDSSGTWVGPTVQINETLGDYFYGTTCAAVGDQWFVAWERKNPDGTYSQFLRGVDSSGNPSGSEVRIATTDERRSSLALSFDSTG